MSDIDPEIAIKVENLSKVFKLPHEKRSSVKSAFVSFFRKQTYERQKVLNDISFDIKKGEFFGIVGRNGSGKSTLLKILAGIYNPTNGNVNINGKLTPFIELGVGFSPELTGRENVFLNGALLGFNRKEMESMYDEIVEFAELENFMDQKLKNYSSGMQVRLAFSIAIRARTDILLLDEVLAVGDAAFQQKCYNYFEELKDQKKTVIFVSHDMTAVQRFCNSAIYINNGNLTHNGTPSKIADIYLEENMESSRSKDTDQGDSNQSMKYTLSAKTTNQTAEAITVQLSYESKEKDEMYIGISVIKDGISVAQIITSKSTPLKQSGRASYYLDTSHFNAGLYEIGAGLFKSKNREILSASEKVQFIIKGSDDTKGAALKLVDTWKYE